MKSFILLEDIVFYANHGVFNQENVVGNEFVINIRLEVDLSKAAKTDELGDTVSYADVYSIVKDEMKKPSKLLEHVAYRIISELKGQYKQIERVEIKLSKRNPPMGGQLNCASIILID